MDICGRDGNLVYATELKDETSNSRNEAETCLVGVSTLTKFGGEPLCEKAKRPVSGKATRVCLTSLNMKLPYPFMLSIRSTKAKRSSFVAEK